METRNPQALDRFSKYTLILSMTAIFIAFAIFLLPKFDHPTYAENITSIASGEINKVGNLESNFTQCLFTAHISWNTKDAEDAHVTVQDPATGQEKLFASGVQGTAEAPWLKENTATTFTLWNVKAGQRQPTPIAKTTVITGPINCGKNYSNYNTQNTYANQTYYQNNNYAPTGGDFSLTFDNATCVGQTPHYTITAPPSMNGETVNWNSVSSNKNNTDNVFYLSGDNGSGSSWSQAGRTWDSADIGTWTKTATVRGVTKTLQFTVTNCGGTGGNNSNNDNYYNNNYRGTMPPQQTNNTVYYPNTPSDAQPPVYQQPTNTPQDPARMKCYYY